MGTGNQGSRYYAASILAVRQSDGGMLVSHAALSIVARSQEEALGVAMKDCKKRFPFSEGYTNHACEICGILPSQKEE